MNSFDIFKKKLVGKLFKVNFCERELGDLWEEIIKFIKMIHCIENEHEIYLLFKLVPNWTTINKCNNLILEKYLGGFGNFDNMERGILVFDKNSWRARRIEKLCG